MVGSSFVRGTDRECDMSSVVVSQKNSLIVTNYQNTANVNIEKSVVSQSVTDDERPTTTTTTTISLLLLRVAMGRNVLELSA